MLKTLYNRGNTPIHMFDKLQEKFEQALKDYSLSMVKHLLENPSFRKHIDVTSESSWLIESSFLKGRFELIDYLFTQPEYTQELKHKLVNHTFCMACFKDKDSLPLVNELFYNPKYSSYIDLTYNATWCFRTAYNNKRMKVLEFLIIDAKIPQNDSRVVNEMYNHYPINKDLQKYCESLFAYNQLLKDLPEHCSNNSKMTKI